MAGRLRAYLAARLPSLAGAWRRHVREYRVPRNLNGWYCLGALAGLALANQLLTGLFLAMHYQPGADTAFDSVQYLMRDVPWGWLIRYMHSTGASLVFVVVYLHMFRGLMYGSYQRPRELVWLLGMGLFGWLMAEAFMGYVLPWGNLSYWGAKVILSLFGVVPVIGDQLTTWLMGDYLPSGATLNRFYAMHVIGLPLALIGLVLLHLLALHDVGSNNPEGIDISRESASGAQEGTGQSLPFHPYYTSKDVLAAGIFLLVGALIVFLAPTLGGWFVEPDNAVPANPQLTPEHIAPVWYFTPFYAILRVVPAFFSSAIWGALALLLSWLLLAALPWIDRGKIRSIRYRGRAYRIALSCFVLAFLGLGLLGMGLIAHWLRWILGSQADVGVWELWIGRLLAAVYFAYFAFLWAYTYFGWERARQPPERL